MDSVTVVDYLYFPVFFVSFSCIVPLWPPLDLCLIYDVLHRLTLPLFVCLLSGMWAQEWLSYSLKAFLITPLLITTHTHSPQVQKNTSNFRDAKYVWLLGKKQKYKSAQYVTLHVLSQTPQVATQFICLRPSKQSTCLETNCWPSLMGLMKCNLKQLTRRRGEYICSAVSTASSSPKFSSLHRQNLQWQRYKEVNWKKICWLTRT